MVNEPIICPVSLQQEQDRSRKAVLARNGAYSNGNEAAARITEIKSQRLKIGNFKLRN
jgi:hypothetical protein